MLHARERQATRPHHYKAKREIPYWLQAKLESIKNSGMSSTEEKERKGRKFTHIAEGKGGFATARDANPQSRTQKKKN